MGPEVLLKGQNGLPDCETLLAHDHKFLAIGVRCSYLLEISTLVQCINVENFTFHNSAIEVRSLGTLQAADTKNICHRLGHCRLTQKTFGTA